MEAIKLHVNEHKGPMTKDKDGDDGGSPIFQTIIEKVDNGYIVVWVNEEGTDFKEVYNDRDELINQLKIFI